MDVLNFISWVKGSRIVTSVDGAQTLLPVGLKDPKRDDGYLAGAISVSDLTNALTPSFVNNNVNLGEDSLLYKDSGSVISNVAIGKEALRNLNSGNNNVAVGYNAGSAKVDSASSVFIGGYSGASGSSSSAANTMVGFFAGYNLNTNTIANTAIGSNALNYAYNSQHNVVIGDFSTSEFQNSAFNIVLGTNSGRLLYNGYYNIFIGREVGYANYVQGDDNIGIGTFALQYIANGSENVALGKNSMINLTNGGSNVAYGAYSASQLTTGVRNVTLGASSASNLTVGSNNVAIGVSSLQGNGATNLDSNVAIGDYAGFNLTSNANFNVFLGAQSGNGTGSGSGNTMIGYAATTNTTGINNSIVLGRSAQANTSNQFVVGSASYPAGSVSTESLTSTKTWTVKINGTVQKILLA